MLLHHYMGEIDGAFRAWGFRGRHGRDQRSDRGRRARAGAEIRTEAPVEQGPDTSGDAQPASRSTNGDEIDADVVVSSLDPRRTFLQLLDPSALAATISSRR